MKANLVLCCLAHYLVLDEDGEAASLPYPGIRTSLIMLGYGSRPPVAGSDHEGDPLADASLVDIRTLQGELDRVRMATSNPAESFQERLKDMFPVC